MGFTNAGYNHGGLFASSNGMLRPFVTVRGNAFIAKPPKFQKPNSIQNRRQNVSETHGLQHFVVICTVGHMSTSTETEGLK